MIKGQQQLRWHQVAFENISHMLRAGAGPFHQPHPHGELALLL